MKLKCFDEIFVQTGEIMMPLEKTHLFWGFTSLAMFSQQNIMEK